MESRGLATTIYDRLGGIGGGRIIDIAGLVERFVGVEYKDAQDRYDKVPGQCRALADIPRNRLSKIFDTPVEFPRIDRSYAQDNPYFVNFLYMTIMCYEGIAEHATRDERRIVAAMLGDLFAACNRALEDGADASSADLYSAIKEAGKKYADGRLAWFKEVTFMFMPLFLNTCVLIATARHAVAVSLVRIFRMVDRYVEGHRNHNRTGVHLASSPRRDYFDEWFEQNLAHLRSISDDWGDRPT